MIEFTQNNWCQRDIINKTKLLTKKDSDMIHDVIPTKYQKYPSNTILKHANILAKVDRLPLGSLINTTSHDAYSIPIHVRTMTLSDISHEQKE